MSESSNEDVQGALLRMYKSGIHTDVNIRVRRSNGVTSFKAHSLILGVRSPVFAAELKGKQHFTLLTFLVEGINPRIMDILLWYLYSDCLSVESIDEIVAVSKVAKYFQIGGVRSTCKRTLLRHVVNEQNVCPLLEASIYFRMEPLQSNCRAFIQSKYMSILRASEFMTASQETVSSILKLSTTDISRKETLEAVLGWLQTNKQADRSVLSNFNMKSIPPEELLDLMEKFPSFLKSKEAASILFDMIRPGVVELPAWYCSEASVTPVPVSAAMIADGSLRVETSCNRQFVKSTLCGSDGFAGSMRMKLNLSEDFSDRLHLVMLELAFGSNYVPEDALSVEIFGYMHSFTMIRKKKVKFSIHATPVNYYLVLNEKIQLQKDFPFVFSLSFEVRGLKGSWDNGPVSDEQYRIFQIPEKSLYGMNVTEDRMQPLCLMPISDWFVLVDPATGAKDFLLTSLYFDAFPKVNKEI